jgi:hypothetical protein
MSEIKRARNEYRHSMPHLDAQTDAAVLDAFEAGARWAFGRAAEAMDKYMAGFHWSIAVGTGPYGPTNKTEWRLGEEIRALAREGESTES